MSTQTDYIEAHAPARRRAFGILSDYALSFARAYTVSVSSDGSISAQGEAGSLQHLVEPWNATPVEEEPWEYRQWDAQLHGVSVRLIEEVSS